MQVKELKTDKEIKQWKKIKKQLQVWTIRKISEFHNLPVIG